VVGAGAAGLGAADRLRQHDLEVTVVEARSRIGGRVWSNASLGATVDLGASWIHGVEDNPLSDLSDGADIDRVSTDYDSYAVRDRRGDLVSLDQVPPALLEVAEIEHEYAADAAALSPEATEEGDDLGGGDVVFPGGYVEVPEQLLSGYDVLLDTHVESVEVDSRATVRTASNDIEADAVLVTVPLGVLKARSIAFVPDLPEATWAAIDRLGMGLLNKVFLEFEDVFWDRDAHFLGHVGPSRDRFVQWVNLVPVTGRPILMAFNAGSAAEAIEELDDDQIVAEALETLRRMYPGELSTR